MDVLVLLGSFFVIMILGVPVAYALGIAALAGALWIELPVDAVMLQIASGVNKFSLLAIPFFVFAGAIMAEGGMSRRLVAFAGVLVGFTPILLPMVTQLGVDPVHFGMIMMVNLGLGLITPPVGTVLFVGSAVGKVSLEQVTRALYPFHFALLSVLALVTFVPGLSLWLPSLVLK